MTRINRYRHRGPGLLFAAGAVFMAVWAAKDMFPLDLGSGPLWTKIFIVAFITCWYGLLVGFVLYGLSWLQTIEIDREEIRVCFGKFVVRRILLERVKTVGMSVQYYSKGQGISTWELVLSEKDRYELSEKGEKYLERKSVLRRMKQAGVSADGPDAAARACLFENPRGILLRMEWTEEAENALRQRLSTAKFML